MSKKQGKKNKVEETDDQERFVKADKTRLKNLLRNLRDGMITGYSNYLDNQYPSKKKSNVVDAVKTIDNAINTLLNGLKYE